MSLASGTRLGGYEILAKLGAGGMGEVYRASDTKLNRDVAIKVLPAGTATDPRSRERLRLEAMAAAALDHPFICKIFEAGEHEGILFLVMEYVAGADPAQPAAARADAARRGPSRGRARSPTRLKPRTRKASSTGT